MNYPSMFDDEPERKPTVPYAQGDERTVEKEEGPTGADPGLSPVGPPSLGIHHADCLDFLRTVPDATFTAIVTDPPYGLSFMGKGWDKVLPPDEVWRECLRVLKPGGVALVFSGTRTFHRLTCSVEDAGFEIRDCMMWLYGSGFPKSLDVSKAIDKAAGAEREVTGSKLDRPGYHLSGHSGGEAFGHGLSSSTPETRAKSAEITAPATPAARTWSGYGTALKPSNEPILWFQKPLTEVPQPSTLQEMTSLLGAALCPMFDAKSAEPTFMSSLPDCPGVSASVAQLVALCRGAACDESLERMGTCSSPEVGSTCLSIATSWSAILGALCSRPSTFTTRMGVALTTACETLKCLILETMPEDIIRAASCPVGSKSSVETANVSSTDGEESRNVIQNATALALVSWRQSVSGTSVASAAASSLRIIRSVSTALGSVTHLIEENTLAPNWEPIVVAMKPTDGTFAANALAHGVAGVNVDGCRVGEGEGGEKPEYVPNDKNAVYGKAMGGGAWKNTNGRWPANLVLDEEAGAMLDEQSKGKMHGAGGVRTGSKNPRKENHSPSSYTMKRNTGDMHRFGDSGGASRFFYCAKASKRDRALGLPSEGAIENAHPTVKPVELMRWLVRLVTMPQATLVLDPFCGSGSTGVACGMEGVDFVGVEREAEYVELARKRIEGTTT